MSRPPTLNLLISAHEGYMLADAECAELEQAGWLRMLARDLFPLLRRSRVLSWELMQLEERRALRMPSTHPLARLAERFPGVRDRRRIALERLTREIDRVRDARDAALEGLTPLQIVERDRLSAYRPVSPHHAVRLTDRGKSMLCALRFSPHAAETVMDRLDARISALLRISERLEAAAWWRSRRRDWNLTAETQAEERLWLAAILARHDSPDDRLSEAEAYYRRLCEDLPARRDPLPLCLVLLSSRQVRPFERLVETNNALVSLGAGAGVPALAAAAVLTAWAPPEELGLRIAELHRLWKALAWQGLLFSTALLPSAARLATVRRPPEATARLFREFENRVTRFDRSHERAVRVAASLLSDLTLDYRDQCVEDDPFGREEVYVLRIMQRYRVLRTAMVSRCGFESPTAPRATVLAAALTLCPGPVDAVLDLFDATRKRLTDALPDPRSDASWLAGLTLDAAFAGEWTVDCSRFAWELYYAPMG